MRQLKKTFRRVVFGWTWRHWVYFAALASLLSPQLLWNAFGLLVEQIDNFWGWWDWRGCKALEKWAGPYRA